MISRDHLEQNLKSIRERIEKAAARKGKTASDILLVAVTKTVSRDTISLLPELGVLDVGENRVQSAFNKADDLPETIHWHMIGHLQRNKVRKSLSFFRLIHSVDSHRLAVELEKEAERSGVEGVDVLVQLNVSGEESKYGVPGEEAERFFETLLPLRRIRITGLMTMAPFVDDPELVRPIFTELRSTRDRLQERFGEHWTLSNLSMGMTQDFEVAIEEGANIVRIGTELFKNVES